MGDTPTAEEMENLQRLGTIPPPSGAQQPRTEKPEKLVKPNDRDESESDKADWETVSDSSSSGDEDNPYLEKEKPRKKPYPKRRERENHGREPTTEG